jgi:hypothetical protein
VGRFERFDELVVALLGLCVQLLTLSSLDQVVVQEAWLLRITLLTLEVLLEDWWQFNAITNVAGQFVALDDHMDDIVAYGRNATDVGRFEVIQDTIGDVDICAGQ